MTIAVTEFIGECSHLRFAVNVCPNKYNMWLDLLPRLIEHKCRLIYLFQLLYERSSSNLGKSLSSPLPGTSRYSSNRGRDPMYCLNSHSMIWEAATLITPSPLPCDTSRVSIFKDTI